VGKTRRVGRVGHAEGAERQTSLARATPPARAALRAADGSDSRAVALVAGHPGGGVAGHDGGKTPAGSARKGRAEPARASRRDGRAATPRPASGHDAMTGRARRLTKSARQRFGSPDALNNDTKN